MNPLKLYAEFHIYMSCVQSQRNLLSPKDLEPPLQLLNPSPFCPDPGVLAPCFLPRPFFLASVHFLLFWNFAFNYETQEDWKRTEVNFHVSTEINFLWKDMPVLVFIEYCCPILMSNLKKNSSMSSKFYCPQLPLEAYPFADLS